MYPEAIKRKLNREIIPAYLAELRKKSHPKILLTDDDASPESTPNVAMIYDNIPITREDLGEWLIGRYGAAEIERMIVQMTVNRAAEQQKAELPEAEIEAELAKSLKALHLTRGQFVKTVLKPQGLSYSAWRQDEITQLKLVRMCKDHVKVTEEDVQHAFEAAYGEKVQARIIIWPTKEERIAINMYPKIRDNEEEFDRAARSQATANLAARGGEVDPIGRYSSGNEDMEKAAFRLKPGEVSHLIRTPNGFVAIKCVKRIPPDDKVKLADVRARLEEECSNRKLKQVEIPKLCRRLQEESHPRIFIGNEIAGSFRPESDRQLAGK
jgi:parvulin-like peptidyl-prolyl isomerase